MIGRSDRFAVSLTARDQRFHVVLAFFSSESIVLIINYLSLTAKEAASLEPSLT